MSAITAVMRRATDYDNPRSIGSRLRANRSGLLVRELADIHSRRGRVSVIDIGGTRSYWNAIPGDVLTKYDVTVTVVNLPGEPHPDDDERFRYVEGDGCRLDWVGDLEFDLAHANSVLEHVGQWTQMRAFAGEVRRVARCYVVQTPYFWFPVEPHFLAPVFHWLPESTRARLLQRFPLGHSGKADSLDTALSRVQSAQLVDATMFRSLFPDAAVQFERLAGLPKSLIGIRPDGGAQVHGT